MTRFNRLSITIALGAVALSAGGAPLWASSLTDQGITYTLLESTVSGTNGLEDQFTLEITGINGPTDPLGGRYGVGAFALGQPTAKGAASGGGLSGFTFMMGGLSSMGCDGSGNFYCFKANTQPTGPALGSDSTLTFIFDVTAKSASDWVGYDPDFKIQWIGTQTGKNGNSGYDLVSQTLTPTVVPLPSSLALLLAGLAALGLVSTQARRLAVATAAAA